MQTPNEPDTDPLTDLYYLLLTSLFWLFLLWAVKVYITWIWGLLL